MFSKIINLIKNRYKILALMSVSFLLIYYGMVRIQSKSEKYTTTTIKVRDLSEIVSATGKIQADEEVVLKFQTSGLLSWIGVKVGDHVQKGQVIAALDRRTLEKQLRQELLDYMNERWDFEQDRDDFDIVGELYNKVLSDTEKRTLEKAQFDLDRKVLDVEITDIALKYATLISPINGIVYDIGAPYAGVNITPANAEFLIADPNKLMFRATVDEVDIGRIKENQKATIVLDAYPDEKIVAEVKNIDFVSSITSGGGTAFAVKFSLPEDNHQQKFKIGMNGDADISIEEKRAVLTVPFEAVREDSQGSYVWQIIDDQPQKKYLKPGYSGDIYTEILEGLNEGDVVVTSGFKALTNEGLNQLAE